MLNLFSSKGQESAPFELLIAVIIMTFVMLFGYRAIEESRIAECRARINQELEKMRNSIESTVNQGSLERIVFEVPQCFEDSKVRLGALRDKHVCSDICQEGRQQCVSLDFWSDLYIKRVCVNIPMHTAFEGTTDGGPGTYCKDRRSEAVPYYLTPITDEDVGIPNGSYVLMDRTPPGHAKPIICAYRMK